MSGIRLARCRPRSATFTPLKPRQGDEPELEQDRDALQRSPAAVAYGRHSEYAGKTGRAAGEQADRHPPRRQSTESPPQAVRCPPQCHPRDQAADAAEHEQRSEVGGVQVLGHQSEVEYAHGGRTRGGEARDEGRRGSNARSAGAARTSAAHRHRALGADGQRVISNGSTI